jgi:hypothetical protein
MADPRADVRFEGIGYRAETFKIDASTITYSATVANGSSKVGLAVTLKAGTQNTIETAADGEFVLGKLIEVTKDNFGVVQTAGYCTLPAGNGAGLTEGEHIVGAVNASAAEGYIREVATATAAELGHARGKIIDPTTTTAVVVDLG